MKTSRVRTSISFFSPSQLRLAKLIADFRSANGMNPTLQELAEASGRKKITIWGHVRNMQLRGILKPAKRYELRSIELADGVVLPKPQGPSQVEWLAIAREALAWFEDANGRPSGPVMKRLRAAIETCSK